VLLAAEAVRDAEQQMTACESCTPDEAEIPVDYIFDGLTGCDPEITDYILPEPMHCPKCGAEVHTGFWRWSTSPEGERIVFVLPGTLVVLRNS